MVLSESNNYVSKNSSHFYNSKKRGENKESNYEYSMPDYFRLLDRPENNFDRVRQEATAKK